MFGFFSKKQAVAATAAAAVPLPDSPPRPASPGRPAADAPDAGDAPKDIQAQVQQLQLRTPSPSVVESAQGAPPSSTKHDSTRQDSMPLEPELIRPLLEPTPASLSSLVSSVPAKTLHAYVLERIPSASEDTLGALCTFFNILTPPPKLHCVRCHKDYVDVENDDRSCLVPHDDDSAEVERVGRSGPERRTKVGTEYETLWGCCGKITEGDGSEGPPDGWCYEGKHTTDIKRARFRADSTVQDDKLVSCLRLNCHGIRSRMPRASTRKRAHTSMNYKEPSDDGSEGESDSGMEEMAGITKPKRGRKSLGKGKEKEKEVTADEDRMDVDEEDSKSKTSSVHDKGKTKADPTTTPAPKRKGRPRKSIAKEDDDSSAVAKTPPTSAKRRGRPPKTKATISDSEPESARGRKSNAGSPVRGGRPQTRSLSRGRQAASVGRLESSTTKRPKSVARVVAGDRSDDSDADQPKKRRKVVP